MDGRTLARRTWLAQTALTLLSTIGCRSKTERSASIIDLPGLQASEDPSLRAELARLRAEQGLPRDLDAEVTSTLHEWEQLLATRTAESLNRRWEKRYAPSWPRLEVPDLASAEQLVIDHHASVSQFEAWLTENRDRRYISVESLPASDLGFVEQSLAFTHLEALRSSVALSNGNSLEANRVLTILGTLARSLAGQNSVAARLTACRVRQVAFRLIQHVLNLPNLARETALEILQRVGVWQTALPAERDVWVADRARGLLVFELVRKGRLPSLLADEDLAQLDRDGGLNRLLARTQQQVDRDQRAYLEIMRELIQASDQPYYQNRSLYLKLEKRLESTSQPTWVGHTLLLPNLGNELKMLAEDRVRLEAWKYLLGQLLNEPTVAPLSELTGQPMQLAQSLNPGDSRQHCWVTRTGLPESEERGMASQCLLD